MRRKLGQYFATKPTFNHASRFAIHQKEDRRLPNSTISSQASNQRPETGTTTLQPSIPLEILSIWFFQRGAVILEKKILRIRIVHHYRLLSNDQNNIFVLEDLIPYHLRRNLRNLRLVFFFNSFKSTRRGRLIHSHQLFRDACLTSTFNLLCGQPISCHWTENGRRSPRFQRLTIRGATRVILAFGWVNLDPFDSPVPRLASREFSGGDDDKSEFVAGKWSRFNDEEDGDIIAIIRIACFMYNDRSIDDVSPFNGYYSWKIIVSRNVVEFISDECISYSDSAPLNCDC